MKHYIYVLQTSSHLYYTGITKDLKERLLRHNTGRGSKFTKNKGPLTLVYYEEADDLSSAVKRERQN